MSEQAAQVPLIELARAVPNDLCGEWQEIDGLRAWHHAPIGRYVHELCDQITELTARAERLQAELAKAEAERGAVMQLGNDLNFRAGKYIEAVGQMCLQIEDAFGHCDDDTLASVSETLKGLQRAIHYWHKCAALGGLNG